MIKINKDNIEQIIIAFNDPSKIKEVKKAINVPELGLRITLASLYNKINKYMKANNVTREEAIEYYKNDILSKDETVKD